jgi:AcrR family transcriptional regulator
MAPEEKQTRTPSRGGRPRANPRPIDGTAHQEILRVATKLFAEQGYAHTTMTKIAAAAGLKQSSLYYYFNRKEQILQATFGVNSAPLEYMIELDAVVESPAVKLYLLLRFDTMQLCTAAWDVNEVERLASLQPKLFANFWRDRQRLHDRVETLVIEGIEAGQFEEADATLTALLMLSGNEGIQNWFRVQSNHRRGRSGFTFPAYTAADVASHYAASSIRALLRRPADLARVERAAAKHLQ